MRPSLLELCDIARGIARDVVAPQIPHVDAGHWPAAALAALKESRLTALVVPEKAGGMGYGLFGLARICEELGQVCASTALCFGMHCVAAAVVAAKATDAQSRAFLEPIAEGKHLTTLALSEPGTGAHFYLPEAQLRETADGFLVRGQKSFVTNGGHADSYVVSTRASGASAGPGDFSCVIVPATAPGISWGGQWAGVGMRGNSARTLRLDDVPIPKELLLGQEGDEIWYVFNVIAPYFLIAMSATYLGIATSALNEAIQHLKSRRYGQGGSGPAHQPVLQHRLGVLWANVERTRQLLYSAATKGDEGAPDALVALCSTKAEVGDCAVTVVNEAMTLLGGKGYSEAASPLFRNLRDARAAHVMSPTTDMLRTWAGRALLGLPILGD
jgi:alkylation response protein AidB-like acyl-CoA dehydrogenase